MASSLPLLSSLFVLFVASNVEAISQTASTVAKDLVPCTMCAECENPCQPLPPPPPPLIECPPPPSPPPPSPPPQPAVIECPPPPQTSCEDCEMPQGPPRSPYPPVLYFPPGTPYPYYVPNNVNNSGGKMKPLLFSNPSSYSLYFTESFIYVACLSLHYYLFIIQ